MFAWRTSCEVLRAFRANAQAALKMRTVFTEIILTDETEQPV